MSFLVHKTAHKFQKSLQKINHICVYIHTFTYRAHSWCTTEQIDSNCTFICKFMWVCVCVCFCVYVCVCMCMYVHINSYMHVYM